MIRKKDVTSFLESKDVGVNAAYAYINSGRTHIYLFILVSELIYAFSFYIVNFERRFKVLKSKFRT